MIAFKWSILDLIEESEALAQVKYRVIASDESNSVTTEGNWFFKDKTHKVIDQTIEKDIIDWIKKESIIDESCIIESNLEKQLTSLNQQNTIKKPWIKPTFTVKI